MNGEPSMSTGLAAPTESSHLLDSRNGRNRSNRKSEKDQVHEAGEVHEVELFSDLVVAVAIHTISDSLFDRILEDDEGSIHPFKWLRFLLQVFMIWYLWQSCMMLTNTGNMFTANELSSMHYVVVFGTMGFIVTFVKAGEDQSYQVAGLVVIIGRILAATAALVETHVTPRPEWMHHERYMNIRKLFHLTGLSVIIEFAPLVVALVWCHIHDLDSAASSPIMVLGAFGVCFTVLALRSFFAYKYDANPDYNQSDGMMLDLDHIQERYALITFIFLGELCFAAASAPGAYYESVSALATAIGCFLLYFSARVKGRTEAWTRCCQSSMLCHHLHVVLFCAIPSMGVAYLKLINEVSNGEPQEEEGEDEALRHSDSHRLLGLTAGVFLAVMGLMELSTLDPQWSGEKPNMSHLSRVVVQLAAGALVVVLCLAFNHSATIVPVSVATTAVVVLWGTKLSREQYELCPSP